MFLHFHCIITASLYHHFIITVLVILYWYNDSVNFFSSFITETWSWCCRVMPKSSQRRYRTLPQGHGFWDDRSSMAEGNSRVAETSHTSQSAGKAAVTQNQIFVKQDQLRNIFSRTNSWEKNFQLHHKSNFRTFDKFYFHFLSILENLNRFLTKIKHIFLSSKINFWDQLRHWDLMCPCHQFSSNIFVQMTRLRSKPYPQLNEWFPLRF